MAKFIDDGGWVPIDKGGVWKLPKTRPYSEVEAMFSLSVDVDGGGRKTIREYSRMWHWGHDRVLAFLNRALGTQEQTSEQDRNKNPNKTSRGKFNYVAPLRRSQEQTSEQARNRLPNKPGHLLRELSGEPSGNQNKSPAQSAKSRRPWHGLGKDLDLLLACDAYVQHLAEQSPTLAQWSSAEIRAWARQVVAKGNWKRCRQHKSPLSSFVHYLGRCIVYVTNDERPRDVGAEPPRDLFEAAAGMGMDSTRPSRAQEA